MNLLTMSMSSKGTLGQGIEVRVFDQFAKALQRDGALPRIERGAGNAQPEGVFDGKHQFQLIEWLEAEEIDWDEATLRRLRVANELALLRSLS